MAEIAGVHRNTIVQAQTVTAQAAPAVVDAVKRGELGLPKAAAIAKLPPDQQAEAISKPLPRTVSVVPPPKTSPPDEWDGPPNGDNTLPEDAPEDDGPSEEEIAEALASEKADRELVEKMLAADDVLAELAAEVKRLTLMVELLTRRNNSLLDEKADAQRWMKKYEARNRHLLKEMDALKKGSA